MKCLNSLISLNVFSFVFLLNSSDKQIHIPRTIDWLFPVHIVSSLGSLANQFYMCIKDYVNNWKF